MFTYLFNKWSRDQSDALFTLRVIQTPQTLILQNTVTGCGFVAYRRTERTIEKRKVVTILEAGSSKMRHQFWKHKKDIHECKRPLNVTQLLLRLAHLYFFWYYYLLHITITANARNDNLKIAPQKGGLNYEPYSLGGGKRRKDGD